MPRPNLQNVPPFYHGYLALVKTDELLPALDAYKDALMPVLRALPADKWDYRYEEGKWSIKEMVQHMIDTDRIFAYRALAIARGEKAPLPGFDENAYAAASEAGQRSPASLMDEMAAVQLSVVMLFTSFSEQQLVAAGTANGRPIDVNAIGFITVGHTLHHLAVLQERYLS